jgi:hypothetical protein
MTEEETAEQEAAALEAPAAKSARRPKSQAIG